MKLVWSEGWLCQGGGGGKKRKLNERWISCEWFFFCLNAALLVIAYIPVALSRKLFGDPCDEPRVHFQTRFRFRARVRYCTRVLCSLSAHRHFQHSASLYHDQSEKSERKLFCASCVMFISEFDSVWTVTVLIKPLTGKKPFKSDFRTLTCLGRW